MTHGLPRSSSLGSQPVSRMGASGRGAGLLGAVLALGALALGGCQDANSGGAATRHAKQGHGAHEAKPLASIPARPATPSVAALIDKAKLNFSPLPESFADPASPLTEEKVQLGRKLYFDKRLSKNHDVACVSCHDLDRYGVDVRETEGKRNKTSLGHRGQPGDRNAPSVYNAGLHFVQFWDGRAKDLEDQAKGPVLNPVEMAMPDEATVVATLQSIPGYVEAFTAAFPGDPQPVSYENMARAIGAYERKLVTPAPFDAFLRGKLTALESQQLVGLALFIDVGCISCHNGAGLGGGTFRKLGEIKPWEGLVDLGRGKLTKAKADEFMFKVPSLRNIVETGPYLHDGSIATLEEMVQKMAHHQLTKGELSPQELSALVAFLGSLTGELPKDLITAPELPPNGPETRAPDPA
jgi:cytochrome c peroxidase